MWTSSRYLQSLRTVVLMRSASYVPSKKSVSSASFYSVAARSERSLREFSHHYHGERNHQGLGNKLIDSQPNAWNGSAVECRERLGGLLRYYYRAAA